MFETNNGSCVTLPTAAWISQNFQRLPLVNSSQRFTNLLLASTSHTSLPLSHRVLYRAFISHILYIIPVPPTAQTCDQQSLSDHVLGRKSKPFVLELVPYNSTSHEKPK